MIRKQTLIAAVCTDNMLVKAIRLSPRGDLHSGLIFLMKKPVLYLKTQLHI